MKPNSRLQSENTSSQEETLIVQEIHWGIFVWVAVFILVLALPLVVQLLLTSWLMRLFGQAELPPLVWLPAILVVLPGLFLLWTVWIAFEETRYCLTTKRLSFRTGWLLKLRGEMLLENVEAVFLVEPVLGSLLGYGTVVVTGTGGTPFALRFMPEPHRFHLRLQQALEAIRSGKPLVLPPDFGPSAPPSPSPPKPAGPTGLNPLRPAPDAGRTPLEQAWEELNKPLPPPPEDDSRFRPNP